MKIRRFIAAVLAILALAAFAGCKKHDKDQTDTTGKNDETVSEDNPESTASVADVNADIKNSRYFLGIDLDVSLESNIERLSERHDLYRELDKGI